MSATEEDITPDKAWFRLALMTHVLSKGLQAGSIVGTVVHVGHSLARKRQITPMSLGRGATVGAVVGFLGAGALGVVKMWRMDDDGLRDRVHRLEHNLGQNRVDVLAGMGGLTGAFLFSAYRFTGGQLAIRGRPAGWNATVLAGLSLGVGLGVLVHVATWPRARSEGPNKMLKEL
ncbi:hypothetical protein HK104_009041 [Borealophlyctis nickersoniae]|nr:hypothetical protein HK104_009041 [Borealophlyctis nickersoniae]